MSSVGREGDGKVGVGTRVEGCGMRYKIPASRDKSELGPNANAITRFDSRKWLRIRTAGGKTQSAMEIGG